MSIVVRPSEARGHAIHGWLDSRHTFSFANYYDPEQMGFGPLRVINEDRVRPGEGFGTHGHRNMEIVSYVIEGALEHKDSIGDGSIIRAGDVQAMSAGSGVRHSEFNASRSEPVHFLQIWLMPREQNLRPGYQQRSFPPADKRGRLRLIASPDGRDGSLVIHQDADIFASILEEGRKLAHNLRPGRRAWVQVVSGSARVGEATVGAGDGVALEGVETVEIAALAPSCEFLLFDLP